MRRLQQFPPSPEGELAGVGVDAPPAQEVAARYRIPPSVKEGMEAMARDATETRRQFLQEAIVRTCGGSHSLAY
jgi:hypothetical protein